MWLVALFPKIGGVGGLEMTMQKNSRILRTIPLLIAFCLISMPAQAQYGGGMGEPNDPYLIYTAEQMNAIGANGDDWHKHFKLMADIDLAVYMATDFNIIGYGGSVHSRRPFSGIFDGNGKRISNFSYTSANGDYVGLFGYVDGEIRNLCMADPNIMAGSRIGALIGQLGEGSVISCCVDGGAVRGDLYVGGLVGSAKSGLILNCYADTTVWGDDTVGGLVGNGLYGVCKDCYSVGAVLGNSDTGGFAGSWGGDCWGCYWDIESSSQSASAAGEAKTTAEMQKANTFLGWGCRPSWTIDEGVDYPRLAWEKRPGVPISSSCYGGGSGTAEDPYEIWTARQMNAIGTEPNDWNRHFKLMANIDLDELNGDKFNTIGKSWRPFTGVFDGNGCNISNLFLQCDLIDTEGLFAYVDGPHAEIRNLGLMEPRCDASGALVGELGDGTIFRCYAYGAQVWHTSKAPYPVGGLVGRSAGTIAECFTCASVRQLSSQHQGPTAGLVGENFGGITRCYSTGEVYSSWATTGGLVAVNSGVIADSYSIADVNVSDSYMMWRGAGGLVGYNTGIVSNCYSAGSVYSVRRCGGLIGGQDDGITESSFWDVEVSGQVHSAGGEPKTTAQLKQRTIFANWDFVEVWGMANNQTYPFLRWQPVGDLNYDYHVDLLDLAVLAEHWLEGIE
jgi:hypothetical protein